jgi:hypothetical protein
MVIAASMFRYEKAVVCATVVSMAVTGWLVVSISVGV